jgi:hypothetical protein
LVSLCVPVYGGDADFTSRNPLFWRGISVGLAFLSFNGGDADFTSCNPLFWRGCIKTINPFFVVFSQDDVAINGHLNGTAS